MALNCLIFYGVLNVIIMLAYYNKNREDENGLLGFITMLMAATPLVIFCTLLAIRDQFKDGDGPRSTEEKVDAIVYNLSSKRRKKRDR